MIHIGVDPGYKGGIGIIRGESVEVFDMPVRKEDGRTFYEAEEICDLLGQYAGHGEEGVVGLEYVRRWVKLSEGIGVLRGVIEVCAVPYKWELIEINPRTWQRFHGIKKADKELSLKLAREKFPELRGRLKRSKDDGRAEALLIADYLRGRKMK